MTYGLLLLAGALLIYSRGRERDVDYGLERRGLEVLAGHLSAWAAGEEHAEAGNMVCVRMRQEPVTARAVPVSAQVEGAPYLSALLKKYSQDVSALYRLALNHKK